MPINQAYAAKEKEWRRYAPTTPYIKKSDFNYRTTSGSLYLYGSDVVGGEEILSFSFTGTKLRYNAYLRTSSTDDMLIVVDETEYVVNLNKTSSTHHLCVVELLDLPDGVHHVKVYSGTNGSYNRFSLSSIDIGRYEQLMVPEGTEDQFVVGDQATEPEAGWHRYDINHQTSLMSNQWSLGSYAGFGENSYSTNFPDATIHFNFIGTKLRIIGHGRDIFSENVSIIIDEQEYFFSAASNPTSSAIGSFIIHFEIKNLEKKLHHVQIKTLDSKYAYIDAIDIDNDSFVLHPDEILSVEDLQIGKKIRCHYVTETENTIGTFSNLGVPKYSDGLTDFIPITSNKTNSGQFYFHCVDEVEKGNFLLIADRNIQNYLTVNTIFAFGSTTNPFQRDWTKKFTYLTGGIEVNTKEDNMWDQYVTIEGNEKWNWSTTSLFINQIEDQFIYGARGLGTNGKNYTLYTNSPLHSGIGFRPVIFMETKNTKKYLVQYENQYYGFDGEWRLLEETEATEEVIKQQGFSLLSMIPKKQWNFFDHPFTLVEYDPEEDSSSLVIKIEEEPSYLFDTLFSVQPEKQLLISNQTITREPNEQLQIRSSLDGWFSDNIATPIVPAENNHPEGVAIQSGSLSSTYIAAKAFDRSNSTYWWSQNFASKTSPEWIGFTFTNPKAIHAISISAANNSYNNRAPVTFQIQAKNEGEEWDVLLNIKNEPNWKTSEKRTYRFNNQKLYQSYRVYITNTGEKVYAIIGDIQMYEYIHPVFEEGVDNLKVVFSQDNGVTWKGNGMINLEDLSDVKDKGLTIPAFNAITSQEWEALAPSNNLRFAFYLEQQNPTSRVELYSIESGQRTHFFTPSIKDLKVSCDLFGQKEVDFFVSRNGGLDWMPIERDQLASLETQANGNELQLKAVLEDGEELHAISYSWV